jgi:hypothetical protein
LVTSVGLPCGSHNNPDPNQYVIHISDGSSMHHKKHLLLPLVPAAEGGLLLLLLQLGSQG